MTSWLLEQADTQKRGKKRTDTYPDLPLSSYRPEDCPSLSSQALLEAHSHPETAGSLQPGQRKRAEKNGAGKGKKIERGKEERDKKISSRKRKSIVNPTVYMLFPATVRT